MKLIYLIFWDSLIFCLQRIILFQLNNICTTCKEDVSIKPEVAFLSGEAACLHLLNNFQFVGRKQSY